VRFLIVLAMAAACASTDARQATVVDAIVGADAPLLADRPLLVDGRRRLGLRPACRALRRRRARGRGRRGVGGGARLDVLGRSRPRKGGLVMRLCLLLMIAACADSAPAQPDAAAPARGTPVVNEISAVGGDFIELANAGDAAADLSGLRLTDEASGAPATSDALAFPDGTTLDPGAFLVVTGKVKSPTGFEVSWGVSSSNGEHVYLLATDGSVLEDVAYPQDATVSGQTYGRFPDGTGAFAVCKPTPGAPNQLY
jgi:hypothetical protein